MYNPSREQARRFFIEAWHKYQHQQSLSDLESLAVQIIAAHPEYHALLGDEEALQHDFTPEDGNINPFLHLSLHLAIEEQLRIDQPPGICHAFEQCLHHHGERHKALHDALECLGEMMFDAQRNQRPPDAQRYLHCLRQRAGQKMH